jgi:hypothetical protein
MKRMVAIGRGPPKALPKARSAKDHSALPARFRLLTGGTELLFPSKLLPITGS